MKQIKLTAIILLTFISIACHQNEEKSSEAELTAEIIQQVDSLYTVYARFDYDWIEFYADEYTAIYPDSPIQHMTKDSLKAQWKKIYAKYDVQLLDRGRPTVIASQDMAISYNSFNEIFINKETADTSRNVGTYIVNWKRQEDNSWKIVFETLQNHEN
ncbi:nuclear transport factor 2 family protein [Marinilongibacter aquaticus]|uniref:YybH family protein n=1 Tax=Marinilongibacter aquaticus TaxID=2975157 RepID=UPI0021BD81F5|nr:nuclear transport factor 2 family protein [Marinilongibacter aquaticus]UBM59500.1 nuclear transport factor 2 family protein [Marinilongibacter aquaticus]